MTISAAGAVAASDVYRAMVVNRAKLAYNSVAAWLEGTAAAPAGLSAVAGMDAQLRLQDQVAQKLKGVRRTQGALGLTTLEAQAICNGGVLEDLRPDEDNRAKELIEYFMIAANGVVAQFLEARHFPSLRRVLRKPERWPRIVELARGLGERLPPEADAKALSAFLQRREAAAPATFPDLSLSVVKLLGAGEYLLKRPGEPVEGHFGLAVDDYTHATAPNRRFPDLITQRLVKAALAQAAVPYDDEALRALGAHCTLQEGNAAKVERLVRKCAAAVLLQSRIGQQFDAIVTGASASGTWVRISHPLAEGRVVQGFEGLDVGRCGARAADPHRRAARVHRFRSCALLRPSSYFVRHPASESADFTRRRSQTHCRAPRGRITTGLLPACGTVGQGRSAVPARRSVGNARRSVLKRSWLLIVPAAVLGSGACGRGEPASDGRRAHPRCHRIDAREPDRAGAIDPGRQRG